MENIDSDLEKTIELLAEELYNSSRGMNETENEEHYPNWKSLEKGHGSSNVEYIRTKWRTLAIRAIEFLKTQTKNEKNEKNRQQRQPVGAIYHDSSQLKDDEIITTKFKAKK